MRYDLRLGSRVEKLRLPTGRIVDELVIVVAEALDRGSVDAEVVEGCVEVVVGEFADVVADVVAYWPEDFGGSNSYETTHPFTHVAQDKCLSYMETGEDSDS